MKEYSPVCYLSVILYIYAKLGRKRSRFSIFAFFTEHFCILHRAFLHSSQSIFAFFTKHFCKPKHQHLSNVTMAFVKRNHGFFEA